MEEGGNLGRVQTDRLIPDLVNLKLLNGQKISNLSMSFGKNKAKYHIKTICHPQYSRMYSFYINTN